MDASGYVSFQMMAFSICQDFHKENDVVQNGKNGLSEGAIVRHLYKEIVANGEAVSLVDLSKSLTPTERRVFSGNEGRFKSFKMFLNKYYKYFRLYRDSGKGKEMVRPVIGIEFCKIFDSKQGCSDPFCQNLHICRHFVKGKCTFGSKCKKPHHFDDPHTMSILQKHYLDGLDHSHLKEFLCRNVQFALDDSVNEASLPKQLEICKYYNVAIGCSREGQCPFLHVCRFYAEDGTCKFGQKCIRKHDCSNDHARFLLQRYNIRESDVFSYLRKRCVAGKQNIPPSPPLCLGSPSMSQEYRERTVSLVNMGSEDQPISRKASEPSILFQYDNAVICMRFLRGHCKSKSCERIHSSMPYCWQYSLDYQRWKEVGRKENIKIEAMFVDPSQDSVTISIDKGQILFKFPELVGILKLQSPPLMQEQPSILIQIRRLSTPDLVKLSEEDLDFGTQWIWYYLDDEKNWQSYDDMPHNKNEKAVSVDSLSIESAYNNKGQEYFEFNCDGDAFFINFKTMTQENRNTRQKTRVKRRPKLFEFDKLYRRNKGDSQLERYFVPRYWKTDALPGISEGDFGQYELLELEPYSMEYLRVFHDFGKTMGYEHEMKIIAVQNLRLWMTYTMERDNLSEKKACKAEEISLYCAVLWQDYDKICRDGFENDNGIHYFAKEAQLVNRYNRPNAGGIFLTFYCRVLANSCLSMAQPASILHDSSKSNTQSTCNENGLQTTNPLMYHVNESGHIYPEFIIVSRPDGRIPYQNDIF